jgi:hypothetical protein
MPLAHRCLSGAPARSSTLLVMRDAVTRRWVDLTVAAALFLVAAVMVSLHVDAYTRVSPVDELQHIDYLYRAPDSPAPGDRVGQQAMNEQACRGLDVPGHPVPPCRPRGTYDPSAFQESGFNTASVNSPVYYTLAKASGSIIQAVTPVDNLVTGARLAGVIWLGGGVVLLYAAARYRGASRWAAAVVGLLLLSAPALLYPAATINPDGQALLWGSALLLLATRWERRAGRTWAAALVAVAVAATLVKLTNIGAVGAVAVYLLVLAGERWRAGERIAARAPAMVAVLAGGASLVVGLAWMVLQGTRERFPEGEAPAMTVRFDVPSFPWVGLLESPPQVMTPLAVPWVVVGDARLAYIESRVATAVLLGGLLAAAIFGAGRLADQRLARSTTLVAIALTLGLVSMNYLANSDYFPLPHRYGAPFIALMAVSAAVCLRGRLALTAVSATVALTLVLATYTLVGL